jgi:hypothetical protein
MIGRKMTFKFARVSRIVLLTMVVTGIHGAEVAMAGERVVFDSKGKVHRIPNIDYKPPARVGGIVPRLIESKKPLELFNPLAPASYGRGRGLVSWDWAEGKPKGFILFSAHVW